jgi:cation diffusion facilitator family transporter
VVAQLNMSHARPDRAAIVARRKRAARASIISNTCLIFAKLGVGLAIGSISVISEAVHSGVDLIAALIAFIAIRIAARPADHSHPYGHGKFENLAGTIESLLIFLGAGIIISEAVQKFDHPGQTDVALWGVLVMAFSSVVNFGVSSYLYRVGRQTDSVALLADAAHLRTDVTTSAGVLVGLGLVWMSGWAWLDPLTALLVAILILKAGWEILLHSVSGLLDASLSVPEENEISELIASFNTRYVNFHELRTRQSGPERYIDFHLVVSSFMSVEEAHVLCNDLEMAIIETVNGAMIHIHVEPESICTEIDGIYRCSPNHKQI